jgi:hypothetical protein
MLRETVKACFFCDFSSFSSCGMAWRVGERVFGEGTTPPCGHPSKGGEFTLAGLGGEFSVDVVLCVDFMAYCWGHERYARASR